MMQAIGIQRIHHAFYILHGLIHPPQAKTEIWCADPGYHDVFERTVELEASLGTHANRLERRAEGLASTCSTSMARTRPEVEHDIRQQLATGKPEFYKLLDAESKLLKGIVRHKLCLY
jgi:hypothetical protein